MQFCIISFAILGPQAPTDVSITISENNTVELKWIADDSTGLADVFKVHLTLENIFYPRSPECSYEIGKSFVLDAFESSLKLSNLEALSSYSVKVSAHNDYGASSSSKKQTFMTKALPPAPPTDIAVSFIMNTDESKISGILKWKDPCKLNTQISFYTITFKGTRSGYASHSSTNASSFRNITLNDLKRGFDYEIGVQAVNSDFPGEVARFTFKTPSGSEF